MNMEYLTMNDIAGYEKEKEELLNENNCTQK